MRIGYFIWRITVSELISGLIFLLMGGYITYLAFVDKLSMQSDYQLQMNLYNAKFLNAIKGFVGLVPEYIWAFLFIGIIAWISYVFIKQYKKY